MMRSLLFLVSILLCSTLSGASSSSSKTARAAFVGHHRSMVSRPQSSRDDILQKYPKHCNAPVMLPTNPCRSLSSSTALKYTISPEPIHTAFSVATFGPQPFWLLLILLPKSDITKKVMGGFEIVGLFCLIHFLIVSASIATSGSAATAPLAEFNDVFDPAGDPQNAFIGMVSNYPNFVAEEWSHVLTWDLLVGRYVWLDGLKRNIFTSHSVLLTNLIGPPGLLLHWLTCLVVGKEPWEKDDGTD